MQFELFIILTSVILYSMKYHRFNKYKQNYEKVYNLNKIIIYK